MSPFTLPLQDLLWLPIALRTKSRLLTLGVPHGHFLPRVSFITLFPCLPCSSHHLSIPEQAPLIPPHRPGLEWLLLPPPLVCQFLFILKFRLLRKTASVLSLCGPLFPSWHLSQSVTHLLLFCLLGFHLSPPLDCKPRTMSLWFTGPQLDLSRFEFPSFLKLYWLLEPIVFFFFFFFFLYFSSVSSQSSSPTFLSFSDHSFLVSCKGSGLFSLHFLPASSDHCLLLFTALWNALPVSVAWT